MVPRNAVCCYLSLYAQLISILMSVNSQLLCLGRLMGAVLVTFGTFSLTNVKVGYQKFEFQKC